ncbi:hypothetical protein ACP275_03G077100 [Erythranthe tilingii]
MELKSPPPCPPTVTVRRNPPRRARATPASAIPLRQPLSSPSLSRDIFSTELPLPQNPVNTDNKSTDPSTKTLSENLKVYLRIRPLTVEKICKNRVEPKNAWPRNPKIKGNSRPKAKKCSEVCVQVNEDSHSVTVSTPQVLQETKRIKSEVYEGFSSVFASEASQNDVYEEMMKPLVEDFLKGKSGMLAAMGPSGSGKTHTVFGCAKEPGMVPLALGRIFSEHESSGKKCSRVFYLSMFEISSEKGKSERMIDLLHDRGGDVCMQQSVLKGVQEALVCDAQQAESLIAYGMLKRATAMTNSNNQSSRSQCIINIRYDSEKGDEVVDGKASSTMLTIVDLAGAEREKKTGNQGVRLLESNFINNTSMVFGLCLRSLLEHQKNRNKPLQKHYQNSLLTRYMRDYLEGKKRMMLILTVKPGVEDYLDTSFLLRQASPFTKIKYKSMEDPVTCNKRPNQAFPRAEQLKKRKFSNSGTSVIGEGIIDRGVHFMPKEIDRNVDKDCLNENVDEIYSENLNENRVLLDGFVGCEIQDKLPLKGDYCEVTVEKDREYRIMQGLSKAMWTVLKQYKKKLEEVEIDNCHLRDSLTNEKTRSLYLENELMGEKMRFLDLENELKELKSQCTCDNSPVSGDDASFNLSQHQMIELHELNSDVSSYSLKELDQSESEKITDSPARDSIVTYASSSGGTEEHYPQQVENLLESSGDSEGEKDFKDTITVDVCSSSQERLISTSNTQDLIFHEDKGIVNMSSRGEVTSQLTSVCQLEDLPESSGDSEGEEGFKDTITVDVCSISQELLISTNNAQNLICREDKGIAKKSSRSEVTSPLTSVCRLEDLPESSGDTEAEQGFKDNITVNVCSRSEEISTSTNNAQDLICCEDKGIVNISSRNEVTSKLTSAFQLEDLPQISGDSEGEKGFKDTITVDVCSKSQELLLSTNNTQDLICCEDKGIVNISFRNEVTSELTSACHLDDLPESSGDNEGEKSFKDTIKVDVCARSPEISTITNSSEDLICCEDQGRMNMPTRSEATSELTSACPNTSHESEEDAINNAGEANNLEPEIEIVSNGSSFATPLKSGSAKSSQNYEGLKGGATGEPTQLDKGATDYEPSLVEDQIVYVTTHSQTVINSSGTPRKDDICSRVDEEQLDNEERKLDSPPPVVVLPKQECETKNLPKFVPKQECDAQNMPKFVPKQECDAQNMPKFVPKLATCSNFQQTEKPKRRLQPASSVLLKDISILDIKDDNDKPKGGRGGGKTVIKDDKNRTQGSLSLLNLLTSNLKQ